VGDQLDLFLDSQAVMLANEAVGALSARDASGAAAALERLEREGPDHPALPALRVLAGGLAGWCKPGADPQAIARAVRWVDDELAPAARQVLGAAAPTFVAGFFSELAEAARGVVYEPAHAAAHRAGLCLRCGEWAEAEEAARAIPGMARNPDALQWLSVARYRRDGLAAARPSLFALAWHAPERLAAVRAELADELLEREWAAFERACEWASVADAELPAWFPAWLLLEHPVVGKELNDAACPDLPAANAARLLVALFDLERQGNQRRLIGERERLRRLNPELFALYMARRTVRHLAGLS
jgi:hypothetical protein